MPGWTRVPSSPQGVLQDFRGRNLPSSEDDVFYTDSVREAPVTDDDRQGYRGGYVVDHLVSWMVEADEDIKVAPEKALKRLHGLERLGRSELSILRCTIVVTSSSINILDNQTGDTCEQFSLDLVDTPFSSTCDPDEHVYNNVLMFYVLQEQYDEMTPCELHVFQVLGCPARDIAMTIDQQKHRRRGAPRKSVAPGSKFKGTPQSALVSSASNDTTSKRSSQTDYRQQGANPVSKLTRPSQQQQPMAPQQPRQQPQQQPRQQPQQQPRQQQAQHSEPTAHPLVSASGPLGSLTEQYLVLLNRAFDDIEQFTRSLQQAIQVGNPAKGRQKDVSAALQAKALPPPERYTEILQKFKLSLNLLAVLRLDIHNPNAAELVHFLFGPLAFVIATAPGQEEFAAKVDLPFLLPETIGLLQNCLSSREADLWTSLGPAWTLTRDDWSIASPVPIYHPRFNDGWEPPVSWLQALNVTSSSERQPSQSAAESAYRQRIAYKSAESAVGSQRQQQQQYQQQAAQAAADEVVDEGSRGGTSQNGNAARDRARADASPRSPTDEGRSAAALSTGLLKQQPLATSSTKLRRLAPGGNGGSHWDEQAGQQQQSQRWASMSGFGSYVAGQRASADVQLTTTPPTMVAAPGTRASRASPPSRGSGGSAGDRQPMLVRSVQQPPERMPNELPFNAQLKPYGDDNNNSARGGGGVQPLKRSGNVQPQQYQLQTHQSSVADLLASGAKVCEVSMDLRASNPKELSVSRGDLVEVLDDERKWWLCRSMAGDEGYVPYTALQKYEPVWLNGDAVGKASPAWRAPPPPPPPPLAAMAHLPPLPPPGPPPPIPPSKSLLNAINGLKLTAKRQQNEVPSEEERARRNFDSELKVQLAEFKKGNWGLSERALRASLSTITPSSSPKELKKWLGIKGFTEQTKYALRSVSAQDLFAMNEAELIRKLGSEDGSRLASLLISMPTSHLSIPGNASTSSPFSSQRLGQLDSVNTEDLPIDY